MCVLLTAWDTQHEIYPNEDQIDYSPWRGFDDTENNR